MPSYKTKAVVLKTYKLGEADKIVKLFSPDHGIIDSISKGSRKIKSKFLGTLELYNFLELEISQGKNLDIITQASILKIFSNISKDFNKFLFCQLISDIVLKTHFKNDENNTQIFKLIYFCFNEIDKVNSFVEIEKCALFFISKFLKILGYLPNLNNCSLCKIQIGSADNTNAAKIANKDININKNIDLTPLINVNSVGNKFKSNFIYFSIKFGGFICNKCTFHLKQDYESKFLLNQEEFLLIKMLFKRDLNTLKEINFTDRSLNKLVRLLQDYLKYHLDINLNITPYIEGLKL